MIAGNQGGVDVARVTLITPYFWPENAACVPLMTELVEDLVKQRHSVRVVTSYPTRSVEDFAASGKDSGGDSLIYYRGARVLRYPNPTRGRKGVAAKLVEALLLWLWAAIASIRLAGTTDVFIVYSNPPLLTIPVSWSRIRRRVPIVYNLQDLFPDSAMLSGLVRGRPIIRGLRWLEQCSYRRAHTIAPVSQGMADHVKKMVGDVRVMVVPNWVDTDRIRNVAWESNRFRRALPVDLESKFVVVYAGNLGFAQDIDVIVDAACILRDHRDIVFVVAGEGQSRPSLERKIAGLQLHNLVLMPLQPQELVADVYSIGDIGLVTVRSGIGSTSVPSKTWPIMACGRPVVACADPSCELAMLIVRENVGMVVPPGDARALADTILAARADVSGCLERGKNARMFVEGILSRKRITGMYCSLVEDLAVRGPH